MAVQQLITNGMEQFQTVPEPSTQFTMLTVPEVEQYAFNEWNDNLVFGTNWLETADDSHVDLSPLSWPFPSYAQQDGSYESSPQQDVNAPATSTVHQDWSVGSNEECVSSELGGVVADSVGGEYYIDDGTARLPRGRKRKRLSVKMFDAPLSWKGRFSLQAPEASVLENVEPVRISESNYRIIADHYVGLCRTDGLGGRAFTDQDLPEKSIFEALITLFQEKFANTLPFLHWSVFANEGRDCLLELAMAAVGSQFLGDALFSASVHEFTRRCLISVTETYTTPDGTSLAFVAAQLLNTVGLAYCGNERLRRHALQARLHLKQALTGLRHQLEDASTYNGTETSTQHWQMWIEKESKTRLAFCIWLIDTMLAIHIEPPATFNLESIPFALPSAENAWQAKEVETWKGLVEDQPATATLVDTLQKLYYYKTFPAKQSEFVRVLVIHGLFHRLWEVERYYSGPLSHWEPSSSRPSGDAPFPKDSPWLPSVATFRNWQNASCDALDVLHWQANSTIGQMRGLEHPTVLHLHFSRVVLLSPYEDILALARSLVSARGDTAGRQSTNKSMRLVRRWAVQHQYKARLACIHAGVTFWHVRRHGIDAFYEAPSVALAALTLWAFSIFADRQASDKRGKLTSLITNGISTNTMHNANGGPSITNDDNSDDDSEDGSIILLDHPTDDELVQQFIRDGATMRPHLGGAGEVFSPRAPPRILALGIKLLRQQDCWACSAEWIKLLEQLRKSGRIDSRPK